jgi:hypothetical protein
MYRRLEVLIVMLPLTSRVEHTELSLLSVVDVEVVFVHLEQLGMGRVGMQEAVELSEQVASRRDGEVNDAREGWRQRSQRWKEVTEPHDGRVGGVVVAS